MNKQILCLLATALFALHLKDTVRGENWPAWRGTHGDGIHREGGYPTQWSPTTNVKWRVPLPEPGNSTPVIWGDHVLVTQPMNAGKQRTLMCFQRRDGSLRWQAGIEAVEQEPTHRTNPYCSPSPVTDGERVICWFGSSGLVAFDFHGDQLWKRPLGKVDHMFGYGQSPIILGDYCYLNFGPGQREFAVAVDKRSGEVVWRKEAPRPQEAPEEGRDIYGTWSTPVVADGAVVFCFRDTVMGLDPQTGEEIWSCRGLGPQMKASPIAGEGVVVALGGKDSSSLAVRTGGRGDVTDTHVLWRVDPARSRMGTGVIHQGHLYANRRNGVIECLELETGNLVWEKRHAGPSRKTDMWSSLTLIGDKLYAISQGADVFILDASPTYKLLATNSLAEHTNSSIAPSQGNLFIRTHEALWCIGQ